MSEDITRLILDHLEKLGIVTVVVDIDTIEKSYFIKDEFKQTVQKGIENMHDAPNPLISALMLAYLYFAREEKDAYEINQVINVLYFLITNKRES